MVLSFDCVRHFYASIEQPVSVCACAICTIRCSFIVFFLRSRSLDPQLEIDNLGNGRLHRNLIMRTLRQTIYGGRFHQSIKWFGVFLFLRFNTHLFFERFLVWPLETREHLKFIFEHCATTSSTKTNEWREKKGKRNAKIFASISKHVSFMQ